MHRSWLLACSVLLLAALAACGGSGGAGTQAQSSSDKGGSAQPKERSGSTSDRGGSATGPCAVFPPDTASAVAGEQLTTSQPRKTICLYLDSANGANPFVIYVYHDAKKVEQGTQTLREKGKPINVPSGVMASTYTPAGGTPAVFVATDETFVNVNISGKDVPKSEYPQIAQTIAENIKDS